MKILQIAKFYPPSFGGIERVVQSYAEGLAARGHEVTILCFADATSRERDTILPKGIRVERLEPQAHVARFPVSLRYLARARHLAREHACVHVHEPFPTATLAVLALPRNVPVVVSWHGDVIGFAKFYALYDPLQNRLCARAARIICSSLRIAQESRIVARHLDRVAAVPFGIETSRFLDDAANDAQAQRWRQAVGGPFVLAVGRLVPYKGFDVAIEAIAQTSCRLAIVGEGPMESALRASAAAAGVADRITFLGGVADADLPSVYRAASLFVLPSTTSAEAFGIVQLEAMASARPVINTRLPTGVPEVSIDGETGLTVPPGDAAALAAAIAKITGDPVLTEKFGTAARQRVLRDYSAQREIDRLESLYRDVTAAAR